MLHRLTMIALVMFLASCSYNKNDDVDSDLAEKVQTEAPAPALPAEEMTQTMPAFQFEDEAGKITGLSDLKGKKVFINMWATWCPPCRVEMPSIQNLYKKVDKEKVVFIMLSLDENFGMAKEYIKANQLDLPVHFPASGLPQMFNTGAIPNTFIFDENGKLIKKNVGMDDYDTDYYVQLLK